MMVPAGRMTATARADIGGRFEARPESMGLGLRTVGGRLRRAVLVEYSGVRFAAFRTVI
jgi:hypothetical protein